MAVAAAEAMEEAEEKRLDRLNLSGDETRESALALVATFETSGLSRNYMYAADAPSLLMAPLFYDRPLASICGTCEFLWKEPVPRQMVEDGLLTPVAFSPYRAYPKKGLELLAATDHVSFESVHRLIYHNHHINGETCQCTNCTRKQIPELARLSGAMLDRVNATIMQMALLPSRIQQTFVAELRRAALHRSTKLADDVDAAVTRTRMITESNCLLASPQVAIPDTIDESESTPLDNDFVANALSIAYSPDVAPETYLQIVSDYRGALKPLVQEGPSATSTVQRLRKINEEIRELASSKRARIVELATNWSTGGKETTIDATISGALAFMIGGPALAVAGTFAGPCLRRGLKVGAAELNSPRARTAKVAAAYYGKSEESVQIWGMRKRFEALAEQQKPTIPRDETGD